MKNYKVSKKLLSLLLAVLMVFSTVSLSVSSAEAKTSACENGQHIYGGTLENVDVTCEKDGYQKNICSECDLEYEVIVKAEGHIYDEDNWEVVQKPIHEASKIQDGTRKNKCLNCDKVKYETVPSEHEYFDSYVKLSDSTCSTKGKISRKCKLCNKTVTLVAKELDPNNHTYGETVYSVNGGFTCQTDGLGVKVCKDCGHCEYVKMKADPAAFHATLEWKVREGEELPADATCSDGQKGTLEKVCPYCNLKPEVIEYSARHDFEGETTGYAATCTNYGEEKGFCKICSKNDTKKEYELKSILPPDDSKHKWLDDAVFEKNVCDVTYLKRCADNITHIDLVTVEGVHTYATEWTVVPATCEHVEYKTNTCTTCKNEIIVELSKEFGDHTYDESSAQAPDVASTCNKVGKQVVWCTTCEKAITRDYPVHMSTSFEVSRTPATCTKEGVVEYKCSECSYSTFVTLPIDNTAHNPGKDYVTVEAATCCSKGLRAKKCNRCGEADMSTIDEIPATGLHTVSATWDVTSPDCYKEGLSVRKCVACNFSETQILAITHNFTNWTYTSVNCKELVTATRYCLSCPHVETQNMTGSHVPGAYKFLLDDENCTTGGTVHHICEVCEMPYEVFDVEAGEHVPDLDNGKDLEDNDPDNIYCGGKSYQCMIENCQAEIIDSIEHSYYVLVPSVPATCTEDGINAVFSCRVCGDIVISEEETKALGHNYTWIDANGTVACTRCGIFEGEGGEACDHFCHNKLLGIKLFYKVAAFFWKLFGKNHFCECGAVHYHEGNDKKDKPIVTVHSREYDDEGKLVSIKYSCTECKVKNKEYKF